MRTKVLKPRTETILVGKADILSLAKLVHRLRVEETANLYGSGLYRRVPSPCEPPLMSQFVFYAVHLARVVVECKCMRSFIKTAKKE